MASNLKRSKRTVGKRVNDLNKRVSRLQKNPSPKRIGRNVVREDNLDPSVIIDINTGVDVAVDFYSNNNQNSSVPTNPTVNNDGSAITHVINTDSTATITFNWNYTTSDTEGAANNIDGFVIHVYQSGSNSSYNFTSSNLETTYFTARDKRSFVFVGAPADKYYTFGVKAYRVVDSNISTTGVLNSGIVKSTFAGEDPFQPSSSISYTGTINGVAASTVSTVATNFNANNDRNSSTPTSPAVLTDGTAVDHTINTDGSADISFEWTYTTSTTQGAANNIDGFAIYVYSSTSSSAYTFGTTPASETVYYVNADRRALILSGVAANLYYTFGVRAYRTVDSDVNADGIIYSTGVIKSSRAEENPYRPSATIAFAGDITGTINGVAASTVSTVATNFNANNDQNSTTPTAPTINSDGTAVDHTLNTDGSVDISFEWNYTTSTTQDAANNIDGFAVYVHSNPQYAITNISATGSVVTYTVTGTHDFVAGTTVVVSGVAPSGYNGTFTVLASPAPGASTFSVSNTTTGTATYTTARVFGSTTYTFGTAPETETVYYVDSSKRAFILSGVAANLYYTFGVRAYRSVNSNINATGILYNASVIKSSRAEENPYRPSSTVAFTGNIGETLANSTPASNVYNATINFNTNNDQISATPNTPTSVVLTSGVQSTNATFDLTTTWAFSNSGDAGNVDGFVVYLRSIQPVLIDSLSASGTVVTYTTKTAHGFSAGNSVVVSGITPVGYTGTFTVLASPAPTSNTFAVSNTTTGTALFTTAQVYSSTYAATDISTSDLSTNIQAANLTAETRSYTFSGMSPSNTYKVAVRAYRVVDSNVNAAGIIFGALANSSTVSPSTPSLGGANSIYIGNGKLYIGSGVYGNSNTGFYVDSGGYFSLKDKLTFNGTTLTIQGRLQAGDIYIPNAVSPVFSVTSGGVVTATSGAIGNYSISGGSLSSTYVYPDPLGNYNINSTITLDTATRIMTSNYYSDYTTSTGYHNVITFNDITDISGGIKVERGIYDINFSTILFYNGYRYGPTGPLNLSDERLKDIIEKNNDYLSIVNAIEPVVFTFKRDTIKNEKVGFIAQELHKVIPDSVVPGGEDPLTNPWTIAMETLIPYIVGSVKELSAKIDELQEKVTQLEAR